MGIVSKPMKRTTSCCKPLMQAAKAPWCLLCMHALFTYTQMISHPSLVSNPRVRHNF